MLVEIATNPWLWALGAMMLSSFATRNPNKGVFVGVFCGGTVEVFKLFLQIGGT